MSLSLSIQRHACLSFSRLFILQAFFLISSFLHAQNTRLNIQSGTTLTVAGNNLLLNNADLQCDGVLDASNGNIFITGSNNTSFSGAGTPLISVLTLNTSASSTLTLNTNIKVSNALNFTNGVVDLNNQQLQLLGSGVLSGENETSRVTGVTGGFVTASATGISNPNQLNIGNLGAALTTSANLGNLTISRYAKPAANPANSSEQGIQRVFLIQPQNNTALNATLRFYYLNAELNGNTAATLSLWKSSDGIHWTQIGADTRNTVSKYVEKTGITDFSYWTLTSTSNPLPLTILTFKATCDDKFALIQWQTGSEINIDRFDIERSSDGSRWDVIREIPATDNPNGSTYEYKDPDRLAASFYRLKIIEQSGSFSYSPVFKGGCADIALPFLVYPNPSHDQAVAQVSVREAGNATIQLFNMNGQLLYSSGWNLQPGINQHLLPLSSFNAGTYIVKVLLSTTTLQSTLIKQ